MYMHACTHTGQEHMSGERRQREGNEDICSCDEGRTLRKVENDRGTPWDGGTEHGGKGRQMEGAEVSGDSNGGTEEGGSFWLCPRQGWVWGP